MKFDNLVLYKMPFALIYFFFAVLLVGCGGGSSSGDTIPQPPVQTYSGSGIALSVETEDGVNINVLAGEVSVYDIDLLKQDPSIQSQVTISGNVPGIELRNDQGILSIVVDGTVVTAGSSVPISVIATNINNKKTEIVNFVVNILNLKMIASGTITSSGGAVISDGGAVGLQIDPGELSSPLGIQIYSTTTPAGSLKIRFGFDRDVSTETALASFTSNLGWPSTVTAQTSVMATETSVTYPVIHQLINYPGYYADGFRLAIKKASLADLVGTCQWRHLQGSSPYKICIDYNPSAAILTSSKPDNCYALSSQEYNQSTDCNPNAPSTGERNLAPVLFIHGYTAGEEYGGGSDTWHNFPSIVNSMRGPNNEELVAFEFRWRTDASFRVVADDLAYAIKRIYGMTGSPVRIVAHSFGGLLVRTLLQSQAATNTSFDAAYVHSAMTLGTPHSGIFPQDTPFKSNTEQVFPDGQDDFILNICNQISCWQAGEATRVAKLSPVMLSLVRAGDAGGLIESLANSSLPSGLPFVVGIGMKREQGDNELYDTGDGLITFGGQRFSPSPSNQIEPLKQNCASQPETGAVTEVVLGSLENGLTVGIPMPQSPVPSVNGSLVKGYSHSQSFFGKLGPDAFIEYAEPYVTCSDAYTCDHAAVEVFKVFVMNAGNNLHPYCISANNTAPQPIPTMEGYKASFVSEQPQKGTELTIPYTVIAGLGEEILGGEIQLVENYSNSLIRSNIDFGPDYIVGTYIDAGLAATATFNGPVYYFEEGSPRIVNAWLDSGSSFSAAEARVTFSDHKVWVNLSGVRINIGDKIIVRLDLQR